MIGYAIRKVAFYNRVENERDEKCRETEGENSSTVHGKHGERQSHYEYDSIYKSAYGTWKNIIINFNKLISLDTDVIFLKI